MAEINSNKEKAVTFLNLTASGRVVEAYDRFVDAEFKHHNQYFSGDLNTLKQGMIDSAKQMPNKIFEIKMVLHDQNLVSVYSHFKRDENDSGFAVMHILKFKNDRIVEMWDMMQEINKNSPNKNGMF